MRRHTSEHSETPKTASAQKSAAPFVPASSELGVLAKAAQSCRGCELYRGATQAVFGKGKRSARVILLGEQPGDQEDKQGEPFVGPAGKLLDRAPAGQKILVTVHPSSLLRVIEEEDRRIQYAAFVRDLKMIERG